MFNVFRIDTLLSCFYFCVVLRSSQGKQDNHINSKIHYLSLHPAGLDKNSQNSLSRSNLGSLWKRVKLNKNIKESKKIDIDVKFINNGRPYRINSKKSKMLIKDGKQQTISPGLSTNTTRTDIIKHIKNINTHRENNKKSSHHHKEAVAETHIKGENMSNQQKPQNNNNTKGIKF